MSDSFLASQSAAVSVRAGHPVELTVVAAALTIAVGVVPQQLQSEAQVGRTIELHTAAALRDDRDAVLTRAIEDSLRAAARDGARDGLSALAAALTSMESVMLKAIDVARELQRRRDG